MQKIQETFNRRFKKWGVSLPVENLEDKRKGMIQKGGWKINYHFGSHGGRVYIEFFAIHRMTNDTLNRIYEDGEQELVGFCQEFYQSGDPQAERAYHEHNREFYRTVEDLGLL